MKTSLLLLLLLVIGVVAEAVAMPPPPWPEANGRHSPIDNINNPKIHKVFGGYSPIDNIDDPEIQKLGIWAVLEHVKRENGRRLQFIKVVSGKEQLVAGKNYSLVIRALNDYGQIRTYKAVVYEWPWTNTRRLSSFGQAN